MTDKPAQPVSSTVKEACLVVIYGYELGRRHDLDAPSVTIGRSNKCDIQIDHEPVSRAHSKIINSGRSVRIRDLGSTNGTFVNDERVEERTLVDGDLIKIGRTIFKFLSGANIERAYHDESYRIARVDGLTQIFNDRYFSEALSREVARAVRFRTELSLILLEIDRLKEVAEEHGHLARDTVLKNLALTIIKPVIRIEDIFARRGDTFGIVLPLTDGAGAHRFAEKIRVLVESADMRFGDKRIPVTVSIGVAALDPQDPTEAALIRSADDCLCRAEVAGGNRTVAESESPSSQGVARRRTRVLRFLRLCERLAGGTFKSCFAAAVLQRRSYAAAEGGSGILANIDETLVSALTGAISKDDVIGVLQDGCTIIVGLSQVSLESASSLGVRIEGELFDQERNARGTPPARVVCGQPVPLPDRAQGSNFDRKGAVSCAVAEAADLLTRRQAEAERGDLLPLPIAEALRRAGSQTHPISRLNGLFALVETISRWLFTLTTAEALVAGAERRAAVQKMVRSALSRPVSDGRWLGMVREVRKLIEGPSSSPGGTSSFVATGELQRLIAVLEKCITDRNRFTHASDRSDPDSAKAFLDDLAPRLETAISIFPGLLARSRPFHVHDIDLVAGPHRDVTYRYGVRWLLGDNPVIAPSLVTSATAIERGRVCAGDVARDAVVMLDPLVFYERCPECKQHEMFFLEGVKGGQVMYKSLPRAHLVAADCLDIGARRSALSWLS